MKKKKGRDKEGGNRIRKREDKEDPVRNRAQDFVLANPDVFAVRALSAHERATLAVDGEWLTNQQARVFAVALRKDLLFRDSLSNLAR